MSGRAHDRQPQPVRGVRLHLARLQPRAAAHVLPQGLDRVEHPRRAADGGLPLFGDPGSLCNSRPPACELGDWFSEGDSPSFLHTIPAGLRQLENPSWGGWGGRFVRVGPRLWADDPSYLGVAKDKASDRSPYPLNTTTLAAATSPGATNAKVTSVNSPHGSLLTGLPRVFYAGDTVTIGTGDSAETRTIATAGTAVPPPTTLAEDAAAGTTNIKVAATAGYAPGDPLTIGSGSTQQNVTITAVGSPRLQTTLAAPAAAGATNIKLQSTGAFCIPLIGCFRDPVLQAGDVLEIGTGADQVTATIESVGTTPGATGDGVTLTEPLARASAAGTSVLNRGGGLMFSPALAASHAIGEPVNSLGGGFTFTEPLRKSHAAGDAVVNYNSPHWPQARWADAIQNDMAARVDWTQKSYREANHQPTVLVAGGRDRRAWPGQRVRLWMVARDPDRDALAYSWWQYGEADTYDGAIRIRKADTRTPWFVVPADAEVGDSIHLVLQVSDDGAPTLTRYKRVVVNVR